MQSFSEFLQESSLSRVHSHTQNSDIAMISAHRGENSPEQNEHTHKALEHDLRAKNYGIIHVHGTYTENKGTPTEKTVHEKSMMVIPHKGTNSEHFLSHMKEMGQKYKQDSILHKAASDKTAKLHGTNPKGSWLKHGETHDVGSFHPNRSAEFMSHLKNKSKSFTFSESVETKFLMDNEWFRQKERSETITYTLR